MNPIKMASPFISGTKKKSKVKGLYGQAMRSTDTNLSTNDNAHHKKTKNGVKRLLKKNKNNSYTV